ncbi:hypothetical protein [Wenyingzhuangia sp. 2_MG-2023]|uniref:hypothetical protein n=1 Tax=Wenyingzhuangia sp. 2_MG-2023 TaxID=3062639 RepID=UPI0026E47A01|nr:hypothetical protein [Wenyingzhuangia sp. 2_MG-2023]MDO6736914.1 hypothetical protein [Wenyingzhuangia sp. 2_MG-2023]
MKFFKTFSILLITLIVVSCGSEKKPYVKSPLDVIVTTYIDQQNYSVILADMNYEESNDSYFHKYRIVIPKTATPTGSENDFEIINTDWKKVSLLVFEQHQNDLGMTVLSKKNGVLDKKTAPAGYDNYVGNKKYGQWQTSSNGTSFWAFYGQYAFMRSMLGWGSGYRYYRDDYNYYNSYRGRQNYYGRNNSFGTNNYKSNTSTWANKPQSFKQKVQSKVKKSAATLKSKSYSSGSSYGNSSQKTTRSTSRYSNSSSSRSRSGGFGK